MTRTRAHRPEWLYKGDSNSIKNTSIRSGCAFYNEETYSNPDHTTPHLQSYNLIYLRPINPLDLISIPRHVSDYPLDLSSKILTFNQPPI